MKTRIKKTISIKEAMAEHRKLMEEIKERNKYKVGQKVKVLIGCIWVNVEIEQIIDDEWYICGTNSWSTAFHKTSIKILT